MTPAVIFYMTRLTLNTEIISQLNLIFNYKSQITSINYHFPVPWACFQSTYSVSNRNMKYLPCVIMCTEPTYQRHEKALSYSAGYNINGIDHINNWYNDVYMISYLGKKLFKTSALIRM